MLNFFVDVNNLEDLRKQYLSLMKKYHPDLVTDERTKKEYNEICSQINDEYEKLKNRLPKQQKFSQTGYESIQEKIINNSSKAREAVRKILSIGFNRNLNYDYYQTQYKGIQWWEEEISILHSNFVNYFWEFCYLKNIIGDEFAKLFELCDFNVEKMQRNILFLSTGAISEKDIHINLNSDNAIPFFDDKILSDDLPSYDSFLLLSKNHLKEETLDSWIEFCQRQRDTFYEKFDEINMGKLPKR